MGVTGSFSALDAEHMARAIALAQGRLGRTWPNPSVGCVVARAGEVLGEDATALGGRPHAEPLALRQAGERARGATLYVSLEPCSHHGQTPPCVDAILESGVSRVVVATFDPDPRVGGRGIELLRATGLECDVGLMRAEADATHRGFFHRLATGRPWCAIVPPMSTAPFDVVASTDPAREATSPMPVAATPAPAVVRLGAATGEALTEALVRLGAAGVTRLAIASDDPLADAALQADLVDAAPQTPPRLRGRPIVVATHNRGKLEELRALIGRRADLRSAPELGLDSPKETGNTYVDNAVLKAEAALTATGEWSLADDGGIALAALSGDPGVETAGFAEALGGWEIARRKLAVAAGYPVESETPVRPANGASDQAVVHCALALARPDSPTLSVHVELHGQIVWPPREAEPGFAPIFKPLGARAMSLGRVLLHRRLAFAALVDVLNRSS